MPFQVSPGVNVSEIDLTTVVPAVATTEGALAGVFRWGPVDDRVLVSSENELVSRFGKPTTFNAETFFTAADFLAYGNKLYVVRVANTTSSNTDVSAISAIANSGTVTDAYTYTIKNLDDYNSKTTFSDTDLLYIAKYPGNLGNSLKISVCDSAAAYESNLALVANSSAAANSLTGFTIDVGANTANVVVYPSDPTNAGGEVAACVQIANNVLNKITVGDLIEAGNASIGIQYLKVTAKGSVTTNATGNAVSFSLSFQDTYNLSTAFTVTGATSNATFVRQWEYANAVDSAPVQSDYQFNSTNPTINDSLHVVVEDENGEVSGVPGTILEVFRNLSRASDAKTIDGTNIYYKDALNNRSQYIWWANHRSGAVGNTAANLTSSTNLTPLTLSFSGGSDGADESNIAVGIITSGFDRFKSAEDVDVSLVLQGKARGGTANTQLANYIINNIVEYRKDCVAFISPDRADTVDVLYTDTMLDNVIEFRNALTSTSYAVMDSGYKYRYDKYNDVYRYTPVNGDIAGLCVRTDELRDAWFSPAGLNRGILKNVVKLVFNPNKAQRDQLYKAGVNPVVTFPGQGTVLYGDKTLQSKPSAFDRINVRRLFIVLEKAISTAAKFTLFEFNDEITRAQFRALVEPFLRDVQGRRGIFDFKVVCDESNNPGSVIDRNEFVGDIYVKPARSINFIQLNFVAVRTGVEFTEVVGSF